MSDKTFNQVEIKPEMISSISLLHTRPPRPLIVIVVVLEERLTKRGALGFERMHNKGRPWVFDILKSLHR